MRVLVTGATTSLGEALVASLVADPTVDGVLAVGLEAPTELPPTLRQEGVVWHQADLTRHRALRDLIAGPAADLGVQAVVHLAMHRSPTATGRKARQLNVDATRLLLRLSEEHPRIRRFVFRSTGAVYQVRSETPTMLREDAPLSLGSVGAQWLRDRVEADVGVCTRMGLSDLRVTVLRCAEIVAPGMGSQLMDYLQGRVCLRPIGFDPMLNLLSIEDAVRALRMALSAAESGIFNIPGADSLPLSEAIRTCGAREVPVPGPLLGPLYGWRRRQRGAGFRYDLNARRFHHSVLLDGSRADQVLGYRPQTRLDWGRCRG